MLAVVKLFFFVVVVVTLAVVVLSGGTVVDIFIDMVELVVDVMELVVLVDVVKLVDELDVKVVVGGWDESGFSTQCPDLYVVLYKTHIPYSSSTSEYSIKEKALPMAQESRNLSSFTKSTSASQSGNDELVKKAHLHHFLCPHCVPSRPGPARR